jgi:glyoxylase-like metal-dependent hydrolase (beta-lactamase superfamily II)
MQLFIQLFTFNPFQENTYVVYNALHEAVIIDPGCYFREEKAELLDFIADKKLKPLALLNTHAHLDHIFGNATVLNAFEIDYYLHPLDLPTLKMAENACNLYGLKEYEVSPEPSKTLSDGEKISFGSIEFEVIFVPGHAPGHVAFYNAENRFLIGGDVVFEGSYGRTDLPGGNATTLKKSIISRVFTLPDETYILSGHGNPTTVGAEKMGNPILMVG